MAKAKSTKSTSSASASATAVADAPAPAAAAAAVFIPVDEHCPLKSSGKVVDDWDAMLNQTNIGANNNKFYVLQLVESKGKFHAWTRWGRVGETGQSALLGSGTLDDAIKCFKAKFKDKTSNNWDDRS